MCGRYALKARGQQVQQRYHTSNALEYPARFNIAPSQPVVTIMGGNSERLMKWMQWGLVPSWAKDISIGHKMINARAETVEEKPSYRASFRRKRCIIPASGFFEWHSQTRDPYYFSPKRELFSFAGLWDKWAGADGSELFSCTIITTEANATVKPVHGRMPVILDSEAEELWLSGSEDTVLLKSLLLPGDDSHMDVWRVSRQVNNPKHDTAEVIAEAA